MQDPPSIRQTLPLPYGAVGALLRDPPGFQLAAQNQHGDIFRLSAGPLSIYFLYHPKYVRHVLIEHPEKFPRSRHYATLRRLLGENLMVTEGSAWRRRRSLAQPTCDALQKFIGPITDAVDQLALRWQKAAIDNQTIELQGEMSRLCSALYQRIMLGHSSQASDDGIGTAFSTITQYLQARIIQPFRTPPAWLPLPTSNRYRKARRRLHGALQELLSAARTAPPARESMLSMMTAAPCGAAYQPFTDEELRCEIMMMYLAAKEATTAALTWVWFLLASHDDVRKRLKDEVKANIGCSPLSLTNAAQLPYTRCVIQETLRLYPSFWTVARQASEDAAIGGYRIPRGATVIVSPFVTHRHEDAWNDPLQFDPDRFMNHDPGFPAHEAYFPFLAGPHECIGSELSLLVMTITLARLLQSLDIQRADNQAIVPVSQLVLCPSESIHLSVNVD